MVAAVVEDGVGTELGVGLVRLDTLLPQFLADGGAAAAVNRDFQLLRQDHHDPTEQLGEVFVTVGERGDRLFDSRYNPAVADAMYKAYPQRRTIADYTLHLPPAVTASDD